MNEIIATGELIQDGIPTPDEPKKIINLMEVNGIQYIDNIPNNMFIAITKEQFCEYQQLKEENKLLKKEKEKLKDKIKQLEEIIDEVIGEIKSVQLIQKKLPFPKSKLNAKELLSILERGKKCK